MIDTSPEMAERVVRQHREMTPEQRMRAAAALFDAARIIVDSSLSPTLTRAERRLARARRIYGTDISPAALAAHADWQEPTS